MNNFFYDSYQLILFFFIPGLFLGIIYDLFRLIRSARQYSKDNIIQSIYFHFATQKALSVPKVKRAQQMNRLMTFIEDFAFCIIAAFTEILLFYYLNGGVIRIYAITNSVIGFLVYQNTISHFITFLFKQVLHIVRRSLYYILIIIDNFIILIKICELIHT